MKVLLELLSKRVATRNVLAILFFIVAANTSTQSMQAISDDNFFPIFVTTSVANDGERMVRREYRVSIDQVRNQPNYNPLADKIPLNVDDVVTLVVSDLPASIRASDIEVWRITLRSAYVFDRRVWFYDIEISSDGQDLSFVYMLDGRSVKGQER